MIVKCYNFLIKCDDGDGEFHRCIFSESGMVQADKCRDFPITSEQRIRKLLLRPIGVLREAALMSRA